MRRIISSGLLAAITFACLIYLAGKTVTVWTARSTPAVEDERGRKEEEVAYAPDEPHPVDSGVLLRELAKLEPDWQPANPEPADRQPRYDPAPANSSPEEVVPAAAIRSADEAECFPLMPYGEIPERLSIMPHEDGTAESDLKPYSEYEQDEEHAQPMDNPKAVEERLKNILQSYPLEGYRRGRTDTMEFRPSDARKGEFDRIPF